MEAKPSKSGGLRWQGQQDKGVLSPFLRNNRGRARGRASGPTSGGDTWDAKCHRDQREWKRIKPLKNKIYRTTDWWRLTGVPAGG